MSDDSRSTLQEMTKLDYNQALPEESDAEGFIIASNESFLEIQVVINKFII